MSAKIDSYEKVKDQMKGSSNADEMSVSEIKEGLNQLKLDFKREILALKIKIEPVSDMK